MRLPLATEQLTVSPGEKRPLTAINHTSRVGVCSKLRVASAARYMKLKIQTIFPKLPACEFRAQVTLFWPELPQIPQVRRGGGDAEREHSSYSKREGSRLVGMIVSTFSPRCTNWTSSGTSKNGE